MLINNEIRSKDKKVDAYIEALETELLSFSGSKVKLLIRSIDNMAGKISKDLDLIAKEERKSDGSEVELSNKIVDTFLKMVKEANSITNFQQVVKALEKLPQEEIKVRTTTVTEEITTGNLSSDENAFEQMQKRIKNELK